MSVTVKPGHGEVNMQEMRQIRIPQRLTVIVMLAQLLERLERSGGPIGAQQYRSVVQHLAKELGDVAHDDTFAELLNAFPAMSELYENLNYEYAGLCRSPLKVSLDSEMDAKAALAVASRGV
jgi:hypothetical protein